MLLSRNRTEWIHIYKLSVINHKLMTVIGYVVPWPSINIFLSNHDRYYIESNWRREVKLFSLNMPIPRVILIIWDFRHGWIITLTMWCKMPLIHAVVWLLHSVVLCVINNFLSKCWLWGTFYSHGYTLIPVWISNPMPSTAWDEINYHLPKFNGCTVDVWELIYNFIPYLM